MSTYKCLKNFISQKKNRFFKENEKIDEIEFSFLPVFEQKNFELDGSEPEIKFYSPKDLRPTNINLDHEDSEDYL